MVDYQKLYHIMVAAAEDALDALKQGERERARELLIAGEQAAEALYLESQP